MVSRDEVPYPTQGTSYTASHGSSPRWGRDISVNIVGANENIPRSPSVTWRSLEGARLPACQQPGSYASSSPRTTYVACVLHIVLYLVSSQWHKRQLKEDDLEHKVSNCTLSLQYIHYR